MREMDKQLVEDAVKLLQAAITEPMVVNNPTSAMRVKDDNIMYAMEKLKLVGGDRDRILDYYGATFTTPLTDAEHKSLMPALIALKDQMNDIMTR